MAWVDKLRIENLRVLRRVELRLSPGLNVFSGANAQGKTSVLEAVALLARGRSFRTDDHTTLIRRGMDRALASAETQAATGPSHLAVELTSSGRRFAREGRVVPFRDYHGHLEAAVYGTERLRIIHGGMRERRLWVDRSASALSPTYRRISLAYDKALLQRNAALERRSVDLPTWDEAVLDLGCELRTHRATYCERLNRSLGRGYRPADERYAISPGGPPTTDHKTLREAHAAEMHQLRAAEFQSGRTLSGPHRDPISLSIEGEDAAHNASSGQARSLLLALTLAALDVHEEQTNESAVALLDDLDSELDEARASSICTFVAERGQALVTTAHAGWAQSVSRGGCLFSVEDGEVRAA